MAETEAGIRARLGIPPSAKRVLILSQSSHMDWDWNETFLEYYNSEVADVLSSATSILAKYRAEKQPYYYSVAETGYLQQFWRQNPSALASLRTSGHTLHMVGGGITSPDSLLNHGEAFIRNFLVGQGALRRNGLPNITNIWVPDDLYELNLRKTAKFFYIFKFSSFLPFHWIMSANIQREFCTCDCL